MTTRTATRLPSLDALRGFAVMGIVLMNVFYFSMPSAAYYNPAAWGGTGALEIGVWATSFVFIEDKMRGLFMALFGASALLMIDRARANDGGGGGATRAHIARMLALFVLGMLHAVLVTGNDILRLYALTGLLLPLFAGASVRQLAAWAIAALAVHVAALGYIAISWLVAYQSLLTTHGADWSVLRQPERVFGVDPEASAARLALYGGDYPTLVAERADDPALLVVGLLVLLPQTLSGMLIGMALLRSGMLAGEWEPQRYRRWAIVCFAVAAPPLALLALWSYTAGFAGIVVGGNALVWSAPFDALMTLGWAAALILIARRFAASAWIARAAAAGRCAFSNYVASSLVLSTIFYGYGLGLFGTIGRLEAYPFVMAVWAGMLLWSAPWLARSRHGPVEWVWRSLATLRLQPLKGAARA